MKGESAVINFNICFLFGDLFGVFWYSSLLYFEVDWRQCFSCQRALFLETQRLATIDYYKGYIQQDPKKWHFCIDPLPSPSATLPKAGPDVPRWGNPAASHRQLIQLVVESLCHPEEEKMLRKTS